MNEWYQESGMIHENIGQGAARHVAYCDDEADAKRIIHTINHLTRIIEVALDVRSNFGREASTTLLTYLISEILPDPWDIAAVGETE